VASQKEVAIVRFEINDINFDRDPFFVHMIAIVPRKCLTNKCVWCAVLNEEIATTPESGCELRTPLTMTLTSTVMIGYSYYTR